MARQRTAKSDLPQPASAPAGPRPKRNLPADERRRVLLDAATQLFSERGFGITMQALADRVHVTQPLVHRYFPTKADLIAAIRDRIHNAHWDPAWREVLADRSRPLEARLADFYRRYLPHIYRDSWYRSFWYAALADPSFGEVYLGRVTRDLLTTMIDEVRDTFSYHSVKCIPPFEREIELVWGMHSTMVFVGIRRYVYHIQVSDDIDTTVRDQISAYLLVAPSVLRELMPEETRERA
jgi:AcrR family transcriptional regulator